ncbi:hypothetical protein WAI453_009127 [Rhynchosporium graminicola]
MGLKHSGRPEEGFGRTFRPRTATRLTTGPFAEGLMSVILEVDFKVTHLPAGRRGASREVTTEKLHGFSNRRKAHGATQSAAHGAK